MNEKIVPEKEQVNLHGVAIDSNLNFDPHIQEICGKVYQKTSVFARLQDYISEEKKNYY